MRLVRRSPFNQAETHQIGQMLRSLIAEKEIDNVARRIRVRPATLRKIRLGQTGPTLETLDQLAQALGVALPDLVPEGFKKRRGRSFR